MVQRKIKKKNFDSNYFISIILFFVAETEGYVKCPLGPFVTRDSEYTLGSIVSEDGLKVEVKLNQNTTNYHNLVARGYKVRVRGVVTKYGTNPPIIQLTTRADYDEINDVPRISFIQLVKNNIRNV